jgi:rod shape-determining protein MreB and related proteins
MEAGITYIGMDLGTFKTSVASSSGVRDAVQSAVGWPKDHVARTMLGRDIVFGKDLVEHRLALEIIRPFEKGVLKFSTTAEAGVAADSTATRRQAAKLLVEHAVSLTKPHPERPVYGVIGAPSRATLKNKGVILEACRDAFDAVMIVSEPFAIAFGMNRLCETLVVDIGAGTTDICPIYGTFPAEEEQVTIPYGGDHVDEVFRRKLVEKYPEAQASANMLREIKEKYGFVHNVNESAVVTLPVRGKPTQFDVTEPLKAACASIVRPIVHALRELIAKFDPEFQPRMLQNIVLGGGGSQLKGLDRMIEEGMKEYGGAKVKKVPDPVYAGATGALKLAMGMPMDAWEKLQHKQVKLAEAVEGYEEHEGHEPQPMVLSARVGGLASRLMS